MQQSQNKQVAFATTFTNVNGYVLYLQNGLTTARPLESGLEWP